MSEWGSEQLKELVSFRKGKKVETSPFFRAGYKPYLGAGSLTGKLNGYASTYLSVTATENDVLMLWDGERSGLVGHKLNGVVSSTVSKLSPKGKISTEYLYYNLLNKFEWIQNQRTGTGVPHVPKDLGRILLVEYPKDKLYQNKLTSILACIDQTIEKTDALVEKYQQIKSGLMYDLYTRGITTDDKLRPIKEQAPELYKETLAGWVPKEWQYDLLDKLADRKSGHTPNRDLPDYWNGGVKWISLSDSRRLDKLYIADTDHEISQLGIINSSAVILPAGVAVMSRDAGVGKSAITLEPMAVSQHFMAWVCGKKMDNHFLYYWLQLNKRNFENIAMGSTIVTIGLPFFKKLQIACPKDLDEQQKIGERLRKMDEYIFSLVAERDKLINRKQGLMHDLLTGKVPVKVEEHEAVHG